MYLRNFSTEDAEQLSRMIARTLLKVNGRDYSTGAIEELIPFFTPERLIETASEQYMVVCVHEGDVVGVASLDGDRVRNVFVDADLQRQKIGTLLMREIEAHALESHQTRLYLHSALSAEYFYRALGYESMGPIDRELKGHPVPEVKMSKRLSGT
jgi:N-acetylglutamate synthase-like GNAT family acetyltransferase